jgi:hypothetical protein
LGIGSFKSEKQSHGGNHGELSPGQELDLRSLKEHKSSERHAAEPGIEYVREILHPERQMSGENQEVAVKVDQIMQEIRALIGSSQELSVQYGHMVVEQPTKKAGKYELAFFDWLLITIKNARMKVEDAGNWLSAVSSRKKQKGYWQQFKKQGTSFALNNERSVATQSG